jgi:phenylpropionate dioxygenase-like ring-hydroxylating dioxygenase large terminal subunit
LKQQPHRTRGQSTDDRCLVSNKRMIEMQLFFGSFVILVLSVVSSGIYAFTIQSSFSFGYVPPSLRARTTLKYGSSLSVSSYNQQSLQDLVNTDDEESTQFPQTWVPMGSVFELDGTRPNSITFLGQEYIVYQNQQEQHDPTSRGWVVVDPTCPHRLAPLREGRIDPETQSLQCSYHGWTFNSSGHCTMIPQLANTAATEQILQNPACHIRSYPCMVEKNILWAWLWSPSGAEGSDAALIETNLPEYFLRNIMPNTTTYTRLLPYSYDILVENILDISHVPFAHHSLQGTRSDALGSSQEMAVHVQKPIIQNLTVDSNGMRFDFKDQTMNMPRIGKAEFRAPYVVQYDAVYNVTMMSNATNLTKASKAAAARTFNLTTILIPVQPGWSRIIIFGAPEKQSGQSTKKAKIPLRWKLFRLLPYWLLHQLSSRFLDSDLMILHEQELRRGQLLQRNPQLAKTYGYFMPSPADKAVVALRQWMTQFASAVLPAPEKESHTMSLTTPPFGEGDAVSLDRYHQHTRQCKHCNAVIEFKLPKWRKFTYRALFISIVLWNRHVVARLATVGCILALRSFLWIEDTMRNGGFHHYKNH